MVLTRFKLQHIPEMHLQNNFEDVSPEYFNANSKLSASGYIYPKYENIKIFLRVV